MSQAKILNNVKKRLQLPEGVNKDELLELLVAQSINTICIYINEKKLPEQLSSVCEELTCSVYRKTGAEGISSETIDNVSYTYSNALYEYTGLLDKYVENRDKKQSRRARFI